MFETLRHAHQVGDKADEELKDAMKKGQTGQKKCELKWEWELEGIVNYQSVTVLYELHLYHGG